MHVNWMNVNAHKSRIISTVLCLFFCAGFVSAMDTLTAKINEVSKLDASCSALVAAYTLIPVYSVKTMSVTAAFAPFLELVSKTNTPPVVLVHEKTGDTGFTIDYITPRTVGLSTTKIATMFSDTEMACMTSLTNVDRVNFINNLSPVYYARFHHNDNEEQDPIPYLNLDFTPSLPKPDSIPKIIGQQLKNTANLRNDYGEEVVPYGNHVSATLLTDKLVVTQGPDINIYNLRSGVTQAPNMRRGNVTSNKTKKQSWIRKLATLNVFNKLISSL